MSEDVPATELTVYWQPGCSSCLRAKEFLKKNGFDYHSVNVADDESAANTLEELGARSIPVVARGSEFVYAQDIDVLARFVGIESERTVLPVTELVKRLGLLLDAAERYLRQLESESLANTLPGRDRSYFALGYHVFVVPLAFVEAVAGAELTYDYYERQPPDNMTTIDELIEYGQGIRKKIDNCCGGDLVDRFPATVQTYYGEHTSHSVLERTAWHTAHHVRQLMELVVAQGILPDGPLGDAELANLPLPDEVYDDEVAMM